MTFFGWVATSIIFLFQHITSRPGFCVQGFCSPQTCHGPIRRQRRTEDHLPQLTWNHFLTQLICQEGGGSQGRKRGEAGVYLFLEGDGFPGHLQSRRDPLLRHGTSGNKLSVGEFFYHLLSKQQKGSCKLHCKTACSYRYNLVLGIQLNENSVRGYVLQEWTQFGSEKRRQTCTGPSRNICWANRKAGSCGWTGGSEVHIFPPLAQDRNSTSTKSAPSQ